MKFKYILSALLCAAISSASAKGDITVKTELSESQPDVVNVIVSMTNAEDEIRGLECTFTLPAGITPQDSSFDEDRFDGFVSTLDIRPNSDKDNLSKVTFMSLGGDYVQGTEGEIFRFALKVGEDAKNLKFTIESEISYGNRKVETVENVVNIGGASPYKVYTSIENLNLDGEGTVSVAIENEVNVGGFEMVVELPEGMEFVTKKNGKVDWVFSSRVSKSKTASESRLAPNKVKLVVIDAMSTALIKGGSGDVISFNVKGSMDLDVDSKIKISAIKVSKEDGKQFNQEDNIEINVKNVARVNEEARQAANEAAYTADLETIKKLQAELATLSQTEYADYIDTEAVKAMNDELATLTDVAKETYAAVETEGEYAAAVDYEAEAAKIATIDAAAKEAKEVADKAEEERIAANKTAYDADIENIQKLQEELSALSETEYANFVDSEAAKTLADELAAMKTAATAALDAVAEAGNYTATVDYEATKAKITALDEAAKKAWEGAQVKLGDINLDGKVNMVDLTTLVNIILQKTDMPEAGSDRFAAADANQDGNIDIADYTAILNVILGKSSTK